MAVPRTTPVLDRIGRFFLILFVVSLTAVLFLSGELLLDKVRFWVSSDDYGRQTIACKSPYAGKQFGEREPDAASLAPIIYQYPSIRLEDEPKSVRADLCKAEFFHSNLAKAQFWGVHLTNVTFSDINLEEANFDSYTSVRTDLRQAQFLGSNLKGASFSGSDLRGAHFESVGTVETDLTEAQFAFADVDSVVFEVKAGALPEAFGISTAKNLSRMKFERTASSLVELRELLKKAGYRDQAREITYAIRHTQMLGSGPLNMLFEYLLFELPSAWGMSPGRPLLIIAFLVLFFAIPYLGALKSRGEGGIWAVWMDDRVGKGLQLEPPVRVTDEFTFARYPAWSSSGSVRRARMVLIAIYFSLISAAQIGWRDLNVGNWISRIQPREYTLRATGWVRVVSGIQSLLSIYLLALWVLTYFGSPFE